MNLSTYVQNQINATLQDKNAGYKTITGFIFTDEDIPVPKGFMIPWQGYHSHVALPNVALNIHRLSENWREELAQFEGIKALYVVTDIVNLSFIGNYRNLKELYVFENNCRDWSFFGKLMELDTLLIRKAPNLDTAPIKELLIKQVRRADAKWAEAKANNTPCSPFPRVLSEIMLNYCNLTNDNLLDLAANKVPDELDLSHNLIMSIDNLKDVSVYYLTLRYNQLTDINALQHMPYYLNVRHNQIKTLPDFSKSKHLGRLFVGHNPLLPAEIEKFKKLCLPVSDAFDL